jgi:hypothetical protein
MTPEEKKRRFNEAAINYLPVMDRMDQLAQNCPGAKEESFPVNWTDPLELYGRYIKELENSRFVNMNVERRAIRELMDGNDRTTPEYIWSSRARLVAERIFIAEF